MEVRYSRIQHAAHYEGGVVHSRYGRGHDLEQWTAAGEYGSPKPACVPWDAEYHHGCMIAGAAYQVYVRRAPLTGTCPCCEVAK